MSDTTPRQQPSEPVTEPLEASLERAAPGTAHLPVSGRYVPGEYFPEAARWTEAELRGHLEYAATYERRTGQPFPRPWLNSEDARGWEVVARGSRWPVRPEEDVALTVTLAPDDYVWLARRARAAGHRPSEELARLVSNTRRQDRPEVTQDEHAHAARPA